MQFQSQQLENVPQQTGSGKKGWSLAALSKSAKKKDIMSSLFDGYKPAKQQRRKVNKPKPKADKPKPTKPDKPKDKTEKPPANKVDKDKPKTDKRKIDEGDVVKSDKKSKLQIGKELLTGKMSTVDKKKLAKQVGKRVGKQIAKEALGTGASLAGAYIDHRLAGGVPVSWEDAKEAAGTAGLELVDSALQGKPLKGSVSRAMNTAAQKQMTKVSERNRTRGYSGLNDRMDMVERYLAQQRKKEKRRKSRWDEVDGHNMRNVRGYDGMSYEGYDYGLGRSKKKRSKSKKSKDKGKGNKKEMNVSAAVQRRQDFLNVFTPSN